jgi:hypothetical protein
MGVFSEMDTLRTEQGEVAPFTLSADTSAVPAPASFDDEERQQAEADTAAAALSMLNGGETPPDSGDDDEPESDGESEKAEQTADQKKAEHEAAEAKRKAEWENRQAAKKAAEEKALEATRSMSNDAVADASVKKLGLDAERLTRRNMKMCVTEHIQTLCLDNPEFARKAMHPRKSMMNCFKYINRKAQEYLKQEMEDNDEKPGGYAIGGDVPDDLCYMWAEEYFNDPDAEVDKEKDEKFVPKPYYGGSSSSKSKKKEPAKKKEAPKQEKPVPAKAAPPEQMQLTLGDVA